MNTIDEEVESISPKKIVKSSGFKRFPLKNPVKFIYNKPSQ